MKPSNLFNEDDRGVSPVIGVILMVAITVILAAVIGTFVLGLGDQIGGSATAGVTVDGDNTTSATVTLTNTGTADRVDIVYAANGTSVSTNLGASVPMNTTGTSVTISTAGDYNVVAISDNGESVLRSFSVTS
jgi:flagellin-like protein